MTPKIPLGGRLALSWVGAYTRTLPESLRDDRREEIKADVVDQLTAGVETGVGERRLSLSVLGRSLRGVPADVIWRLQVEWERDRLQWLVTHPSTILTVLFSALIPVVIVGDASRERVQALRPFAGALAVAVWALSILIVAYSIAVVLTRVGRETAPRDPERPVPSSGSRILRYTFPAMVFLAGLSALWRFAADPLDRVSSVAYGMFGIALVINLSTLPFRTGHHILHNRKISS